MTSTPMLPLIGCFILLAVSLSDSHRPLRRDVKNITDKCEADACGPPISITFIPNPPQLNTDCAVLVNFKLVYDFFGGSFFYDVRGDEGFHMHGNLAVTVDRPYLKGETLLKNYTYHLPPYIKAESAFYFNLTLKNDEGQLLSCVYGHCMFAAENDD